MTDKHSVDRVRSVDRTATVVSGALGKLNLPQRTETILGVADRAVTNASDRIDQAQNTVSSAAQTADHSATAHVPQPGAATADSAPAISSARSAGASFASAAGNITQAAGEATQAGLNVTSGALNTGRAAIHGAQSAASAGATIARPLAAHGRMALDAVSTLQAEDDGELVKRGLVGNPERIIVNRFLPASMRQNPLGTAPRLVKHVTLDAPKRAIQSYRDGKAAIVRGKHAAHDTSQAIRAAGSAAKHTARAGHSLMRSTRAGATGTGQAGRAVVRGTKPAARAVGRVASRAAEMVARGVTVTFAAIRAAIAGLITVLTSISPITIAIVAIVGIIVLIFTWFGWLLPSLITEEDPPPDPGQYGVAPPGPWGGHENGRIPESELTEISFAPGYTLRADAAAALLDMNTAYRAEFGNNIIVNDAYRDYAGQVEQREYWCARGSCGNAAAPGTSNHGWALAVDLGGGINSWTSSEHAWMVENAATYGYFNPDWAAAGNLNEPWHWDFWGVDSEQPGGGHGADNEAQEYARSLIIDEVYYGITVDPSGQFSSAEAQWVCLKQLWTGESNWDPRAENPSSGAYGIPQAWPGEKMATFGDDWKTNPETQINWGLDYIKNAYQTPCGAWDFWNSNDPHWY